MAQRFSADERSVLLSKDIESRIAEIVKAARKDGALSVIELFDSPTEKLVTETARFLARRDTLDWDDDNDFGDGEFDRREDYIQHGKELLSNLADTLRKHRIGT